MGRERRIPFSKKRLEYAIKACGYNKSSLTRELNKFTYETLKRAFRSGKISRDVLDDICQFLDVSPNYIRGENLPPGGLLSYPEFLRGAKDEYFTEWECMRTDPDGEIIPIQSQSYTHIAENTIYRTDLLLEYVHSQTQFKKHFHLIENDIHGVRIAVNKAIRAYINEKKDGAKHGKHKEKR